MEQTNSVYWKIDNFADLTSYQNSLDISYKSNAFHMGIEPKHKIYFLDSHTAIYLFRDEPRNDDVSVLWKISLINENGDECLPKDIETSFTAIKGYLPVIGGLYHLDRDYILEPSNRLLPDGKLVIKCEVTVQEDSKLPIVDPQLQIAHVKALNDYQSLLESSKHTDVVFVVGSKQFKLHKAILSARSPVFAAMFDSENFEEGKKNRVEITDVEADVFEEFLRFIYSGNVEAMEQYAADLLVVSDKYQLESLKHLCEQSLSNSLTVETVTQVLTLADMHHANELKSNCIKYITSNAPKVTSTKGWKLLAKDLLLELYEDMTVKFENKRI